MPSYLDAAHSDPVYSPMADEQRQRQPEPAPWQRKGDSGDPIAPKVTKPDTRSIIEKLKRVAPNQARRYKQRAGE